MRTVFIIVEIGGNRSLQSHLFIEIRAQLFHCGMRDCTVRDKLVPVIPGIFTVNAVVSDAAAIVIEHLIQHVITVEVMAIIAVVGPAFFQVRRGCTMAYDIGKIVILHFPFDHVIENAVLHRKHGQIDIHILKRDNRDIFKSCLSRYAAQGKGRILPLIIRIEIGRIHAITAV